MNKQKILELTGLDEEQFYDQFPDQESFCNAYPEACSQLEQAQQGMEITPEIKSNWNAYIQANKANITPDWNHIQTDPNTHQQYYPGNKALEQWNANNPNQAIQPEYIPAIQQSFNNIQNSNSQLGTRMQNSFKNKTGSDSYSKKDAIIGTLTGNQLFPVAVEETYRDNKLVNHKDYGTNVNMSGSPIVPSVATNYTSPISSYPARQNTQMSNVSSSSTNVTHTPPQRMSAKQTMNSVGTIGAPVVSPLTNTPSSIPLQNTIASASTRYTPPVTSTKSFKPDPNSIVDTMKSKGMDSSFANRKKLAEEKGITGYTGTATQNMTLMDKINPTPVSKEMGGDIFSSMNNFKQGGYYGMDQKFHSNSDSGTYVTGAGYYFPTGGQKGQFEIADNQSRTPLTSDTPPGQLAPMDLNQNDNPNAQYEYPDQTIPEDPTNQQSQFNLDGYTSSINPSTGFKDWSKDGKVIDHIKRDDAALWNNLKEQGHGARWQTGQTDIQRVGRTAGAIGNGLGQAVDVAGAIGGYLNNRNNKINTSNAAINNGSTAGMFTNPQSSGKGDYGVTGSEFGQFKPNQMGNYSFKGMYQAGGGFSNLFANAQTGIPISSPIELANNFPIMDNIRISAPKVVENVNQLHTQNNTPVKLSSNSKGKDIATRFNNPGNIIYSPIFAKMFGAIDSGIKQTDGNGHFAAFPNIDAGLKARETQLFGDVDGIFKSKYYKANTDIDTALKTWSNKGYGVNIYPEIAGKTLAEITPQERKELMKRQIKRESGSMYKYLKSNDYFKYGGQQQGGQVMEMDENEIQQFLKNGGQLEFLD